MLEMPVKQQGPWCGGLLSVLTGASQDRIQATEPLNNPDELCAAKIQLPVSALEQDSGEPSQNGAVMTSTPDTQPTSSLGCMKYCPAIAPNDNPLTVRKQQQDHVSGRRPFRRFTT